MSWNYRVVRIDGHLRIFDVYYDDAGMPVGRHAEPTYVYGDAVEDLAEQLSCMAEALKQPVLDDREIGTSRRDQPAF